MAFRSAGRWEIIRKNSHHEKLPDGGWKRVDDPDSKHVVELLINDEEIIAEIAVKATRTKKKQSKYLAGAIVVREVLP